MTASWSSSADAELRRLYAEGHTLEAIARMMMAHPHRTGGYTKNMIAGRIYKLRLSRRPLLGALWGRGENQMIRRCADVKFNDSEDPERCVASVYQDTMQCYRKRGHGPDGLWCKQHAAIVERQEREGENEVS